jgi:hypothetical protein
VEKNVEKQWFSRRAHPAIPTGGRFPPGEGLKMPDFSVFCGGLLGFSR